MADWRNINLKELPKPLLAGVLVVLGVIVLVLVGLFGAELYVRVVAFRVRVTPSTVEQGETVVVRWPVIKGNQARYPFERISFCRLPVTRRTLARNCRVVLAVTANDGQEILTVSVAPGTYKALLQALDSTRQPIPNILQLSNAFRVIERSEGGAGDGGGPGGGGGGGAPPQPPPPPDGYGPPPPPPAPPGY